MNTISQTDLWNLIVVTTGDVHSLYYMETFDDDFTISHCSVTPESFVEHLSYIEGRSSFIQWARALPNGKFSFTPEIGFLLKDTPADHKFAITQDIVDKEKALCELFGRESEFDPINLFYCNLAKEVKDGVLFSEVKCHFCPYSLRHGVMRAESDKEFKHWIIVCDDGTPYKVDRINFESATVESILAMKQRSVVAMSGKCNSLLGLINGALGTSLYGDGGYDAKVRILWNTLVRDISGEHRVLYLTKNGDGLDFSVDFKVVTQDSIIETVTSLESCPSFKRWYGTSLDPFTSFLINTEDLLYLLTHHTKYQNG